MTDKEKKITTYVFGGLGLATIMYLIFGNNSDNALGANDPTGNGNVPIDGNGNPVGNTPTFNAHKVATDLYDAMKSTGIASWISGNGDEQQLIGDILKKVTQTQFGQVVTAFGKLAYNPTWGNQSGVTTLTKYGLKDWLLNELGGATNEFYKTLKSKYPLYL